MQTKTLAHYIRKILCRFQYGELYNDCNIMDLIYPSLTLDTNITTSNCTACKFRVPSQEVNEEESVISSGHCIIPIQPRCLA